VDAMIKPSKKLILIIFQTLIGEAEGRFFEKRSLTWL